MAKTNFSTKYLRNDYFLIIAFAATNPPTAADIPPTIAPTGQNNAPTATAELITAATDTAVTVAAHSIRPGHFPPPHPP